MTEPTDDELDIVLYKHWPAFATVGALPLIWIRAAFREAIAKWCAPQPVIPSDAEIDAQWRESVEKHETTAAFVRDFARAVLAKWGTPPAVVGEPVAWLSVDCIGERYLCFTKPNDSDPARPLVFGDATPQPTQAQAGVVPLTDEQIEAAVPEYYVDDVLDFKGGVRFAERHHGIKGGQHGAE